MDEMTSRSIRIMQDYLESHMNETITLQMLARVSGYSPYHCAHLFKRALGISPFAYLRKLRLTSAASLIRDSNEPITTIAFDFQFGSHEGFTKAFAKQFGLSPRDYRKKSPPIPIFRPYLYHLIKQGEKTMDKTRTVFIQIVERPRRKLVLRRGIQAEEYFSYCEEVGCDVWGVLCSIKEALGEPMGLWLPKQLIPEGTSKYVQGVEVPLDYDKELPDGFEMIELDPGNFMIFQGEPYQDEEFETEILGLQETIENYHPETVGYRIDENGPTYQLEPRGERGYIEAIPVVKI